MATPAPSTSYPGPQCPLCGVALADDEIRTGMIECRTCGREFEATAFTPPEKRLRVLEVAVTGPEGAAACANHARNAAVTSCERCGLFICSLCEMNVGQGAMCPSCFERARSEGTLTGAAGRVRDFASMAKVSLLFGAIGFTFFGVVLGPLGMFYAWKAIRQRRESGDPYIGMIVAMIIGALEAAGSVAFVGLMIFGMLQG
jgi:hypothetical protein